MYNKSKDNAEDLHFSDFDWIENTNIKLGTVSSFYLEKCENNVPKETIEEEEALISFINLPNSEVPKEIPCYREIRSKKQKYKKRAKQVKIEITKIESVDSEENEITGCVNPGLYINVLEEEVPVLMEEQKVKKARGFADDAQNKLKGLRGDAHKEGDFEEFNIYDNSPLMGKKGGKKKQQMKKMRPSKSQHSLVHNKEPFEFILEQEKMKTRKSGMKLGFEEDEIDPFKNDDFVYIPIENDLKKRKNKEYSEQQEGNHFFLFDIKKRKKI